MNFNLVRPISERRRLGTKAQELRIRHATRVCTICWMESALVIGDLIESRVLSCNKIAHHLAFARLPFEAWLGVQGCPQNHSARLKFGCMKWMYEMRGAAGCEK